MDSIKFWASVSAEHFKKAKQSLDRVKALDFEFTWTDIPFYAKTAEEILDCLKDLPPEEPTIVLQFVIPEKYQPAWINAGFSCLCGDTYQSLPVVVLEYFEYRGA